jgi:hypothetical protein
MFHGPLIANGGFNRDTATRALADGRQMRWRLAGLGVSADFEI